MLPISSSFAQARILSLRTAAVALLVACGGSGDAAADSAAADASAAQAAAPVPPGAESLALLEFTDADLDAFERGMTREAELVRASRERERTATTPDERGAATQSGWAESTIPEGAKAAGMELQRYTRLRATLNDVLQTLDFQGKIDGPLTIDTARIDAAMKAKLAADPITALPPASAAALRARLDRTAKPWIAYTTLVAVAG